MKKKGRNVKNIEKRKTEWKKGRRKWKEEGTWFRVQNVKWRFFYLASSLVSVFSYWRYKSAVKRDSNSNPIVSTAEEQFIYYSARGMNLFSPGISLSAAMSRRIQLTNYVKLYTYI
jgi:hypothetical protein